MAWSAPTFDITGKSYLVDPRPVQDVIEQGANLQKDQLKNLAGVVQGGIDVAQGMMARRQLSELKAKVANLDPLDPDYAVHRANLLADNMTAFTDPRTKGVASEILSGFDKARDNDLARKKAAITANAYAGRLGLNDELTRGRNEQLHGYRAEEQDQRFEDQSSLAAQKEALRRTRPPTGGAAVRTNDAQLRAFANAFNGVGGGPAAETPAATPTPAPKRDSPDPNMGLEPDFPAAIPKGTPPDNTLLNVGQKAPDSLRGDDPAPVAPAPARGQITPLPPTPVKTAGDYPLGHDDDVAGAVGSTGPAGVEAPAPPAGGGPSAEEARLVQAAQHPGIEKAAKLAEARRILALTNKDSDTDLVREVTRIKTYLEGDEDIIQFEAENKASLDLKVKEIMDKAKKEKTPEETAAVRKELVEAAVDFDMAAGDAMVKRAENEAADLRAQLRLKDSDRTTLGPLLKEADAKVTVMQTALNEKRALSLMQWREVIDKNPNAFLEMKRAAEKEQMEKNVAKSFDDFVDKQDDPGMQGSLKDAPPVAGRAVAAAKPPGIDLRGDAKVKEANRVEQAKANDFWNDGKRQVIKLANLNEATDQELQEISERALGPGQMRGLDSLFGLSQTDDITEELASKISPNFMYPSGGDNKRTTGRSGKVPVSDFLQAAAKEILDNRKAAAKGEVKAQVAQATAAENPGWSVKKVTQN